MPTDELTDCVHIQVTASTGIFFLIVNIIHFNKAADGEGDNYNGNEKIGCKKRNVIAPCRFVSCSVTVQPPHLATGPHM